MLRFPKDLLVQQHKSKLPDDSDRSLFPGVAHATHAMSWAIPGSMTREKSQEETSLEANERQVQRTGSTCFGVGGAGTPAEEGRMDIWKCSIVFGIYIYIYIIYIYKDKEIWEECVKHVYKVIDMSNYATTINGRYVAVDRSIPCPCSKKGNIFKEKSPEQSLLFIQLNLGWFWCVDVLMPHIFGCIVFCPASATFQRWSQAVRIQAGRYSSHHGSR